MVDRDRTKKKLITFEAKKKKFDFSHSYSVAWVTRRGVVKSEKENGVGNSHQK